VTAESITRQQQQQLVKHRLTVWQACHCQKTPAGSDAACSVVHSGAQRCSANSQQQQQQQQVKH
jgi:hypothetical protein